MGRERRFISADDLEVRADDGSPKIAGYAARFGKWTNIGGYNMGGYMERIKAGAFADSIKEDRVKALFNHDPNIVLGDTENGSLGLSEDRKGLFMESAPPGTQAANDVVALIDERYITGQSFGFTALEDKWETKEVDGAPMEHRTVTKARLYDVGPVTFPAYDMTDITVRSAREAFEARQKELEAPADSGEPVEDVQDTRGGEPERMYSRGNTLVIRQHELTLEGDKVDS